MGKSPSVFVILTLDISEIEEVVNTALSSLTDSTYPHLGVFPWIKSDFRKSH